MQKMAVKGCDLMSLKEIANEAGVSIATVFRVLNDPGHKCSSDELRERITRR